MKIQPLFNAKSGMHRPKQLLISALLLGGQLAHSLPAFGTPTTTVNHLSQLAVPILGVTLNPDQHLVGTVTHVVINFHERNDHEGLRIRFRSDPGQFSPYAQQAVHRGITHACQAAHLKPDSWTIYLTFPYRGWTLYGDSLSAMVGLSVVAMAKGDSVIYGRSITGTITEDGHIGVVGSLSHKIEAAYAEHMTRVLVPEELDAQDGDWKTPFMMHVSPVGTVDKAYYGLTGKVLK